jgi:hypothetical protein
MDYAVDYTAYLMNEGEEPAAISEAASEPNLLKGQNLIDDFIEQSESADKEKSLLSLSDIKPACSSISECIAITTSSIWLKSATRKKSQYPQMRLQKGIWRYNPAIGNIRISYAKTDIGERCKYTYFYSKKQ